MKADGKPCQSTLPQGLEKKEAFHRDTAAGDETTNRTHVIVGISIKHSKINF